MPASFRECFALPAMLRLRLGRARLCVASATTVAPRVQVSRRAHTRRAAPPADPSAPRPPARLLACTGATNGALYADCHEELGSFDLVARYPSAPCLSLPPGRGLAPLLAARQPLARPQPQRRPSAAAPAAGGMPAQSAVFESAAFESAAFESEPGHEPIGSRQGLAPRHGAGRGPPPAAPAAPQAPHPQAVVPPPWPGADALADLAQAEGMDVSELLDGFPNELDLLALEPDHSEH